MKRAQRLLMWCGEGDLIFAHRFRHTLATEVLGRGASFEDVADILGNSPEIVRKHYGKWSPARQARIDDLMEKVHAGTAWIIPEGLDRIH